ncbi:hypothetical protein NDU88_000672, partial [Pleurodeles waltl]
FLSRFYGVTILTWKRFGLSGMDIAQIPKIKRRRENRWNETQVISRNMIGLDTSAVSSLDVVACRTHSTCKDAVSGNKLGACQQSL